MARRSGLSSRVRSSKGRRAISCTPSAPPQEPAAVAARTDSMPPICRKAALSVSLSASMQKVSNAVVVCRCVAHLATWSRSERTLASLVCRAASISRDFLACRRLTRFATRSSTSSSRATHSSCEPPTALRYEKDPGCFGPCRETNARILLSLARVKNLARRISGFQNAPCGHRRFAGPRGSVSLSIFKIFSSSSHASSGGSRISRCISSAAQSFAERGLRATAARDVVLINAYIRDAQAKEEGRGGGRTNDDIRRKMKSLVGRSFVRRS